MLILLAENDPQLGKTITDWLTQEHHLVEWLKDAWSVNIALTHTPFDTVVIDDNIEKPGAKDLLKTLRANSNNVPILVLTEHYSIETRIAILDNGADDCLLKPFDLRELSARLRSLQRRNIGYAAPLLSCAGITLNPATYTVTHHGEKLVMPPKEFLLLKKLLEGAGRVLSREQLCQSLYGWNQEMDSNALEVHIHNLRRKLGIKSIRTIRGVGYMMEKE